MASLLHFITNLSLLGMATVGFVCTISIFLRWLEGEPPKDFSSAASSAESQISQLQDDVVSDMFDLARTLRFERRIDGGDQ